MNRRAGIGEIIAKPRRTSRSGASSRFVGRDEEMRRLGSALTLAADGRGSIAFLTGQPGIGKTRLAREALSLAKARGLGLLEGRAYPLEAGLAYVPFIKAFTPLRRGLDPSRLAKLVDGLSGLGRLFGILDLPPPSASGGLSDRALEKPASSRPYLAFSNN